MGDELDHAHDVIDDALDFLSSMASDSWTGIDLGVLARDEYEIVKFGERSA